MTLRTRQIGDAWLRRAHQTKTARMQAVGRDGATGRELAAVIGRALTMAAASLAAVLPVLRCSDRLSCMTSAAIPVARPMAGAALIRPVPPKLPLSAGGALRAEGWPGRLGPAPAAVTAAFGALRAVAGSQAARLSQTPQDPAASLAATKRVHRI